MIPKAHAIMENLAVRPSTQGKPPRERNFKWQQRVQNANTHIILTKGIGIDAFMRCRIPKDSIRHRMCTVVKEDDIKSHLVLPRETLTHRNMKMCILRSIGYSTKIFRAIGRGTIIVGEGNIITKGKVVRITM
jgi:hypothetical protein